jgi:calcineurin-like phosphoesterase family protein
MPSVFLVSDTHFGHTPVFAASLVTMVLQSYARGIVLKKWTKLWSRLGTNG